jgi:hypothetical protein
MGTGGPFPGGKARPGLDADISPPSSAEGKHVYELYYLSPCRLHARSGTASLLLVTGHKSLSSDPQIAWVTVRVVCYLSSFLSTSGSSVKKLLLEVEKFLLFFLRFVHKEHQLKYTY